MARTTPLILVERVMTSFNFDKLLPWLVLAVGLTVTYFLQLLAFNGASQSQQDNFGSQTQEITLHIEQRIAAYEQVLRGIKGLYIASKSVERNEFHDYVDMLHLADNYPGIQNVGFGLIVPPQAKTSHITAIRKEGFPNYTLHPDGKRNLYVPAVIVEPFTGHNLQDFGYDIYSDAVRRMAMDQARDLDQATSTSKVSLMQETKQSAQAGFIMYLPVYRNGIPHETLAERRANIIGWLFASMRMNDLMYGIIGQQVNNIDFEIFDGENASLETLMYDAHFNNKADKSLYHTSRRIVVAGHPWLIKMRSLPAFEANLGAELASLIRLTSGLMSVLLSVLVWQIISGRARALNLAKGMTRELRVSEERLKLATASGQVGIWEYNLQTNELIWDDNMFALYGARREDFSGAYDAWSSRLHPDDKTATEQALQDAIAGIREYEPEFRVIWPDGEVHYIKGHAQVIKDQAGNSVRIIGTNWDNRAHANTQQQLQFAHTAINKSKSAFFWLNAEGQVTDVNDYACQNLGYSREELLDMHVWDIDPDLSVTSWPKQRAQNKKKGTRTFEALHRRKDGTIFPVEITTNYISVNGEEYSFSFAQDITERRLAEQDLRIAATAFEAQEGILVTDLNNVILRVNQSFTKITGYTTEEVVGKTPALLSSGRHDAEFFQRMWRSLNSENSWHGEIWNRRKNGEVYPEWLTISAVIDAEGQITNYVGSFFDISQYKEAEDKIELLAFYDPLTGLPNRRLLQDRLQHAFAAGARHLNYGALLFIDMDNFKTLNDTRGHNIGDLLLVEVGKRLQTCVREVDTVARLGGDEFVVLLEKLSVDIQQAATLAEAVGEKILAAFSQPYNLKDYEYYSSASIGISLFHAQKITVNELLKRADTAMYQAKGAGRNALRFYDPAMQEALEARAALESDLRCALAENQFRLYYQMQVYHNGHILAAEVLLRWQHPQHGLISPMEFITLAEESGLIVPIGQWVLETVCAQLKAWESNIDTRFLKLAINVSARQFHQADFVGRVREAILESKIDPDRLDLELTESLVLDDIDDTIAKMQALKALGVRFSMDDFGTGYSSLSYLSQLPLDQLKIDQSFVRNINVKESDAVIVQTIIGMANNLGMEVIAEGVETEEQRAFLEQHGCPVCQGYLFGKPMPLEEFEVLLKQG